MTLHIKVRTYKGGDPIADIHLIETEGVTQCCLMHGEMSVNRVKKLYKWFKELGIKVEREKSPLPGKRRME